MARKIECDNCGKQRKGQYYLVKIIAIKHGQETGDETVIPDCCGVCLKALKKGAPPKRRGRKPIMPPNQTVPTRKKKTATKKTDGQSSATGTPPSRPVVPPKA